jgi:hypothetical protein
MFDPGAAVLEADGETIGRRVGDLVFWRDMAKKVRLDISYRGIGENNQ